MNFNCPRNFKQGRLIANRFRVSDLILASSGISISVLSVMICITAGVSNAYVICSLLLPGIICFVLVCPTGIYHNFLVFITIMIRYGLSPKLFVWEGIYKYDSKNRLSTDDES